MLATAESRATPRGDECCPPPLVTVIGSGTAAVDVLTRQTEPLTLTVTHIDDSAEVLLALGMAPPQALVIDIDAAPVTALDIVRVVRKRWSYPIVVGVDDHHRDATDAVLAAGASACVARPYRWDDLHPYVALAMSTAQREGVVRYGDITLNRCSLTASYQGHPLELSMREFDVLEYLVRRQGRIASRKEIGQAVWGSVPATNTVVVHIRRLRAKLGDDPDAGEIIRTIRGAGYRIEG